MTRGISAGERPSPRRPGRILAVLSLLVFGCTEPPPSPSVQRASAGIPPSRSSAGRPFAFTTIDPPDATGTTALGIGGSGDVVGAFTDAQQVMHGFLLSGGSYTIIDYPGAVYTEARGIGPNGEIVGAYRNAGEPTVNYHGYLRSKDGRFARIDYPGHTNTIPQRILPDGTIIGCYHDADLAGSMHAMIMGRRGNEASTIFSSMHDGATPSLHRIAGRYTDPATGENRGYLLEGGVLTPLMAPGSSLTQAWDMNPAGDVAGLYRDGTGFHGFVLTRGDYTPLDVPGAAQTRAYGINAKGNVVGNYVVGTRTHGFIATR